MEKDIFKFEKTGKDEYAAACGHVTVTVRKSIRNWSWELKAAANDGYPAMSRRGSVKAGDPQEAQRMALEDAFSGLDDAMETGIDDGCALEPDEGGAYQAVWEMLEDCGCEPAA